MSKKPVTPPPEDEEPTGHLSDDWDDQEFLEPLEPPEPVRDPTDLRPHTRELTDLLRARYPQHYVGVEIGTLPLRSEDELFSDFINLDNGWGVRVDYDDQNPTQITWISAGNRDYGGEPCDLPRCGDDPAKNQAPLTAREREELFAYFDSGFPLSPAEISGRAWEWPEG